MKTEVGTDIEKARTLLLEGETVAIPTETVYGLAANGFDPQAIGKIFEAKNRPSFDPLILHIASVDRLEKVAEEVPEMAKKLAKAFWPGPLTLILKKKSLVPDLATSGMDTVGIRIPRHPMTLDLLESLDFPLAAPSANPFGYISPTSADHVYRQMSGKIPYVLDGGPSIIGLESTIVDISSGSPRILRKGGIPIEQIERVIGKVEVNEQSSSNPRAPGMLESHYAPRVPLLLGNINELVEENPGKEFRVLGFASTYGHEGYALSPSGDLNEAAQNLFSYMRRLDSEKIDVIFAEPVPEQGLGRAINDRLRRAAKT
jgi:L-threonylcarbamoyladenylate synthase